VLNACEGARASGSDPFAGVAQSLVARGIPAVVAMQFEITDRAAIVFAHEFYTAITDGLAIEGAVGEARRAIFGAKSDVEWGTAVLYMRAEDGRLFDLAGSPEPTLEMEHHTLVMEPPVVDEPAESELPTAVAEVSPSPQIESASDGAALVGEPVVATPEKAPQTMDEGAATDRARSMSLRFRKIWYWVAIGILALVLLPTIFSGGASTSTTSGATEFELADSADVAMVPTPGITVDGNLADWDSLTRAYRLRHPVRDSLVENRLGSDSEGTLWVAYDDTSMYLAVDVDDDVYSQTSGGNQIWRGDAVDINLFLGLSGDTPDRPDSRTVQLTMTPRGASGRPEGVLFVGNGQQFADNSTNLPVELRGAIDADGDWRLEARIPWDMLGLNGPPEGLSSAMFAVFDNDGENSGGNSLQAEILANLEGVFFQQPRTWGTLTRE
jgi:hypothetical protein